MLATLAWQDEQLGQPPDRPARAARRPRRTSVVGDAHQRRPRHGPHRRPSSPTSSASTTTSSRARTTAGTSGPACRCGGTPVVTDGGRRAGPPASTTGPRPQRTAARRPDAAPRSRCGRAAACRPTRPPRARRRPPTPTRRCSAPRARSTRPTPTRRSPTSASGTSRRPPAPPPRSPPRRSRRTSPLLGSASARPVADGHRARRGPAGDDHRGPPRRAGGVRAAGVAAGEPAHARPRPLHRAAPVPDPSGGGRRHARRRASRCWPASRCSRSATCSGRAPALRVWVEAPGVPPRAVGVHAHAGARRR